MIDKIEIRESLMKGGCWVANTAKLCTTYIQPDGSLGRYYGYNTITEAQTAKDLYLVKQESPKGTRQFDTGATRDTDAGKLDYEAFNNPLVDKRYASYLHKHRKQSDGQMRDGDNWQKLFGEHHTDVCIKSLCRHIVDVRLAHRGYQNEQPLEDSLCAIIFNAKAYLLKLLLDKQSDRTKPVDGEY